MGLCLCLFFILVIAESANGFSCPGNTEELKLKFNQLSIFDYYQGCGSANTDYETALLESQGQLNCGPDGYPVIEITDWETASTHYIKKLCMSVTGASEVTLTFNALTGPDPEPHIETIPPTTNKWYRFCLESGDAFESYMFDIYVEPKYDGSDVAIKNAKLTTCRFYTNA